MSAVTHYAGKVGALARSRPDTDPELIEARRKLRAERLAAHIEKVVAEAPRLSDADLARLASLLRPTAGGGARGPAA